MSDTLAPEQPSTPDNPELAAMLDRAGERLSEEAPADTIAPPGAPPAPPSITISAESFPGLCMGFTMLSSLSLNKIGYGALTEKEGEALTAALLKNVQAWELDQYLGDKRVCAGLDLAGVVVAIMLPRVLAENRRPNPVPALITPADAPTPASSPSSSSPAAESPAPAPEPKPKGQIHEPFIPGEP